MKNLAGLALFCAGAFVAGCASTAYMDPNDAPQNVHWRFNRYDFQLCSVAMTEDLLSDTQLAGRLRQQFPDRRPVLEMAHVENATFQHGIDLSIMTDTIRMRLQKSGLFDIVDHGRLDAKMSRRIVAEVNQGLVRPLALESFGQQRSSDYYLVGRLIEDNSGYGDGRVREVYYKLSLQLYNRWTGVFDWIGEKELLKARVKGVFGW